MNPLVTSAILAVLLFFVLIGAQYLGRLIGRWRIARDLTEDKTASGVVEGAVFALLGLLLAFTFNGADGRFEMRRAQIIDQVNALSSVWMRMDLLPAADQPAIRDLFKRYVDQLGTAPETMGNPQALTRLAADLNALQDRLWGLSVAAVNRDGRAQVATLFLPALERSFDLSTSRLAAARINVHPAIVTLLIALSVIAGFLAGHTYAATRRPDWLHMTVFAALISATLYFIMDYEYPRFGGLITLDSADVFMDELRAGMND